MTPKLPPFAALGLLTVVLSNIAHAQTNSTWFGGTDNWIVPARWSPNTAFPNNSGPTTYNATVNAGVATLTQNITIQRLTLGNAEIPTGSFTLLLNTGITWITGKLSGNGIVQLAVSSTSSLTAGTGEGKLNGITLINGGSFNFVSGDLLTSGGVIQNSLGATFTLRTNTNIFEAPATDATFNNIGTLVVASPTGGFSFDTIDTVFNNSGSVTLQNTNPSDFTALSLAGGGVQSGTFTLPQGAELEFGSNTTLNGGTVITGDGIAHSAGQVVIAGSISAQNLKLDNGTLDLQSGILTITESFTQAGGTLRLRGGTLTSSTPVEIQGGVITGAGALTANLTSQGTIAPGEAIGQIAIQGGINLLDDSRLIFELGGTTPITQYDVLTTTGAFTLGGSLELRFANGFQNAVTSVDTFTIVTSGGALTNFFANISSGQRLMTADGLGSFLVTASGQSVVLSSFLVPEPSIGVALLSGLGVLLGWRRRR